MVGKVDRRIVVEDSHFEYLRLQKGSLDPLANNRPRWHAAYEADLSRTYDEIAPFLPPQCWGLLDIGSGLGGIDVLLSRHYGTQPFVNLLDGEADPPEMRLHRETFNDMQVARDFMKKNGLRTDRFHYYTPAAQDFRKPYDLVVSFGSWCFHYAPDVYLPALMKGGGLHVDSVLIVDLRRDKPDWTSQLWAAGLRSVAVVRQSKKFDRIVWQRA